MNVSLDGFAGRTRQKSVTSNDVLESFAELFDCNLGKSLHDYEWPFNHTA